ncbi:MAG TPA: universal stress protein [Actinomycetospora sp.]|jgi:nucleotide-binding universal stress UspA family protein|uniref:universal stress protein n=1 Tax=Actinomycetospora sp. TaxID=1872135 RepID=UPI002F407956
MTDGHGADAGPRTLPGHVTTGAVHGTIGGCDGDRVGAHRARSVRVFAPADRSRRGVLRWAARHAARTDGFLEVLLEPAGADAPPAPAGLVGLLVETGRDLLARIVGPLRPAASRLTRELTGAVAGARLLVVPQSLPQLPALVEMVTEPLVSVPDRPLPRPDSSVVLALAPWTGPEVIGAAFETAARYGVDLRAVRAVSDPRDADEAARSCEDDLAAWRLTRPEVTVDVEIVDREPTEALMSRARDAQLVVTGRPARGRARELVEPSPASELLRLATCPVLVVPPPGAPRTTWSARPEWGAVPVP